MNDNKNIQPPRLSVIIPVTERHDDIRAVYAAYREALTAIDERHEFIFVLDGDFPAVQEALQALIDEGERLTIIKMARWFGEATALTAGFEHAKGEFIITLPPYLQVEPAEIGKLIAALDDCDLAIGWRYPRQDSLLNRIQNKAFHIPLRYLTGQDFHDLGCSARAMKRRVLEELQLYGDQHRFLPLLAFRQGFRVKEVQLQQAPADRKQRIYSAGVYLRRLLDILTIFFLIKFTKKPFRFFGLMGTSVFVIGSILLAYLAIDRLAFDVALANRPLLLLSSLLIVLGIQIFAIGLVGEIIIFTHARDIKEYTIEEIIN